MATNPLKFYKGWYGKSNGNALPANLPDVSTAIIFNEEEGVLYLNNKRYGGATDVTFTNGVLTITYSDGRTPVSLDFNDTASARSTMEVFEQIANLIGTDAINGTLDYEGTNYLAGENPNSDSDDAKSLVDADRILDEEIKNVNDRIDDLDATNVQGVVYTPASGNDGASLVFKGVSQDGGQVGQGSGDDELQFAKVATTGAASDVSYNGTTSQMNVTNVQAAIDTLDSRLDSIESLDTYDTVVSTDAATTPYGASWKSGETTINGSLVASADTMHKIYLVPDTSVGAGEHTGTYNEYISVRTGTASNYTYTWELIGSTKADLTDYVKNIVVNGKTYSVDSNNTVTLTNVITGINGESTTDLNNTDYINVKATTTPYSTNGTNITTLSSSVKTQTIANATNADNGLATALDVKNTIETLDAYFTGNNAASDSKSNVTVSLVESNGVITSLGVGVNYATITKTDGTVGTGSTVGTDSTLVVASGDENKLVIGSDITKLVTFTNNRISEEIAKLDATESSSNSLPVVVTVTETDGKVTSVGVTKTDASVTYNNGIVSVTNNDGLVLGSDIHSILSYVDNKVPNVTSSKSTLDVSKSTTNGKDTYDVNLCWTEFADNSQNNNQNNEQN